MPAHHEAFDEACNNNAKGTLANTKSEHSRRHLDIPAHRVGSFGHWPQARDPDVYSETAMPLLSICIDGQPVCQMPLKTPSHMQNPLALSIEVSSSHSNKRLRTGLSDTSRYKRTRHTSPPQDQTYAHLQPVPQPRVSTQRAHLDGLQDPKSHQRNNEFRQCKPASHEIRHPAQPAYSQTWKADPALHIRTFERSFSHIRRMQSTCRMRANCREEARYIQEAASPRGRCL